MRRCCAFPTSPSPPISPVRRCGPSGTPRRWSPTRCGAGSRASPSSTPADGGPMPAGTAELPEGLVDLLVIGGGVNGAGIARDAAGRGLSVILVEKDDLAQGT